MHASDCAPTTTSRPTPRQHRLENGVLERVAVVLLDERLGLVRSELGHDLPVGASPREAFVGVLDPDHGDPFTPRLLDKTADLRDDRVALVCPLDNAVLHVDDEECGVLPVLECGHDLSSTHAWLLRPVTVDRPTDTTAGSPSLAR